MPRVPTLTRQIRPAPLPDTRTNFAPTRDTYGGELADTAVRAIASVGGALADEQRQKADDAALLEFDNTLAQWEHQNLYDPQTGALNTVKGKDAVGLTDAVGQKFKDFSGELVAKLLPRQQEAANRRASMRWQDMTRTLDSYGSREADAYEQQQTDASVKTSIEAAAANATDPVRVNTELQRQALVISGYAQKQGWSPELTTSKIQDAHTATHVSVIDNLLAQNKDVAASTYFDAVKDQISGDKLAQVQRAVEEGSLQGEAFRQADVIVASTKSLADAEAKIKGITDPKLRERVSREVEHQFDVNAVLDRQAKEQTMISLANRIDKGGLRAVSTSAEWSGLSIPERTSLEMYAKRNLSPDGEGKTDLQTYYDLMTTASTKPDDFAKTNLMLYVGKLGKTEFKQLAELQGSIRKADNKAESQIEDFSTKEQVWNGLLSEFNINKNDPDALKLRRVLDQRYEQAQEISKGKRLTNTEMRAIADDLMSSVVLQKGKWYGLVVPGVPFNDVTTRKMNLDVPPADRQTIIQELQRQNQPVTDGAILDYYLRWKKKIGEIP